MLFRKSKVISDLWPTPHEDLKYKPLKYLEEFLKIDKIRVFVTIQNNSSRPKFDYIHILAFA